MLDTVTRKVGEIARYDVFRIVVFDSFKVSEFAFDGFDRSEKITDLNIKSNGFCLAEKGFCRCGEQG